MSFSSFQKTEHWLNPKICHLYEKGAISDFSFEAWSNYTEEFAFDQSDINDLISVLIDPQFFTTETNSDKAWSIIHAWRALGQLKAQAAILPIIQYFEHIVEEDMALQELHFVFALIGEPAIEPLMAYLKIDTDNEYCHVLAVSALTEIAKLNSDFRAHILDNFVEYMRDPNLTTYDFNGLLISHLIDLKAVKVMDSIANLYKVDCVDHSICGDFEDVQIAMGVIESRTTQRPKYSMFARSQIEQGGDEVLKIESDFESAIESMQSMQSSDETEKRPRFTGYDISEPTVRDSPKIGRNDPCCCGSGKKFKKCCA